MASRFSVPMDLQTCSVAVAVVGWVVWEVFLAAVEAGVPLA